MMLCIFQTVPQFLTCSDQWFDDRPLYFLIGHCISCATPVFGIVFECVIVLLNDGHFVNITAACLLAVFSCIYLLLLLLLLLFLLYCSATELCCSFKVTASLSEASLSRFCFENSFLKAVNVWFDMVFTSW